MWQWKCWLWDKRTRESGQRGVPLSIFCCYSKILGAGWKIWVTIVVTERLNRRLKQHGTTSGEGPLAEGRHHMVGSYMRALRWQERKWEARLILLITSHSLRTIPLLWELTPQRTARIPCLGQSWANHLPLGLISCLVSFCFPLFYWVLPPFNIATLGSSGQYMKLLRRNHVQTIAESNRCLNCS
jgi:hypothetical protein